MSIVNPTVFIVSAQPTVRAQAVRSMSQDVTPVQFSSPLEFIAAVSRTPPLFAVVHLSLDVETWVTALEVLVEQPNAPRLLLLTEPSVLDDVMSSVYRDGVDQLLLWPAEPNDLLQATQLMFGPANQSGFSDTLPPGLHDTGA